MYPSEKSYNHYSCNLSNRYLSNLCYLRLEIVQRLLPPLWPQMRKRLLAVWKADIRPFPHSWTWTPFSVNANSLYIINKSVIRIYKYIRILVINMQSKIKLITVYFLYHKNMYISIQYNKILYVFERHTA